ncbi:hypothetical protein WR25_05611 isoform B, partial [Diploscapter pachys]
SVYFCLFKTPKAIKCYSVLILNFALSDLGACMTDLFVANRIIPTRMSMAIIPNGFCIYISSGVCFVLYALMLHFFVHSLFSLLLSFAYRYYVLCYPAPSRNTLIVIILIVYLPTFTHMVIYLFANDDPKELEDALRNQLPNYSFEDTKVIIGTVDTMKSLPTLLMTLYMVVPIIPVYAIILLVRLKVRRKLDGIADKMSHHTRRMHHTLLNALTCQAILPIFYLEAVITFVIQTLGINHKLLEYSVFSMILMIPSLSPVINIYFIRPYRSEVNYFIQKDDQL